jgi:CMP/dCMP kinase
VFLTAESAARADRRAAEASWSPVSPRQTQVEQDRRDRLDAPQSGKAADAVEIDSTRLDLNQVVGIIVRLAQVARTR